MTTYMTIIEGCRPRVSAWTVGSALWLALILVTETPVVAGDDSTALRAYNAAWSQRDKLLSGRFEIKRTNREFGPTGAVFPRQTTFVIELAGPRVRFQSEDEVLVGRDEERILDALSSPDRIERTNDLVESGSVKKEIRKTLYVETESHTYLYLEKGAELRINTPSALAKRAVGFFDLRTLGLRAAPTPETVASGEVRMTGHDVQNIDNQNVVRVHFLSKQGVRTTVWIKQEDSTVIRIDDGDAPDGDFRDVTEMTSRLDPASRVVYPEKVTNQKYEGGRLIYESLMTVTKAEINVSIDGTRFSPQRFGLVRNTMVYYEAESPGRLLGFWDGDAFRLPNGPIDQVTLDFIHGLATRPAP